MTRHDGGAVPLETSTAIEVLRGRRPDLRDRFNVHVGELVTSIGGAWSLIPGSATVEGSPSSLQVLTSKNRLYSN